MGLMVSDVYTQNNVLVVTTNTVNTVVTMDVYDIHVPSQRVCTDGSSSSTNEDAGSFDMSIYRILSKQDDMKTLMYPDRVKNEFELFLQYAQAKSTGSVNTDFDALDSFLGQVGVSVNMCKEF